MASLIYETDIHALDLFYVIKLQEQFLVNMFSVWHWDIVGAW